MQQDHVEIPCSVEAHTEQALLINHGGRQVWVPLSQILQQIEEPTGPMRMPATTAIVVPTWVAQEKCLEAAPRDDAATLDLFGSAE